MKSTADILTALLMTIFCIGCVSIDTDQPPIPTLIESTFADSEGVIYLGQLSTHGRFSEFGTDAYRLYFKNELKASRRFSVIEEAPKSIDLGEKEYLVDIDLYPDYKESINWWYSWPAVYPMIGYWPLQYRSHEYEIAGNYTITGPRNQLLKAGRCKAEGQYQYTFYGFYQSDAAEEMIYNVNEEFLETCARKVTDAIIEDVS